jgi:hypothetical protein
MYQFEKMTYYSLYSLTNVGMWFNTVGLVSLLTFVTVNRFLEIN